MENKMEHRRFYEANKRWERRKHNTRMQLIEKNGRNSLSN